MGPIRRVLEGSRVSLDGRERGGGGKGNEFHCFAFYEIIAPTETNRYETVFSSMCDDSYLPEPFQCLKSSLFLVAIALQ